MSSVPDAEALSLISGDGDRRALRLGPLGRKGERAIVINCAAVGVVLLLLFVLERVGASDIVVGSASLSAPLASILILSWLGRSMEASTFLRADGAGGALVSGLAMTTEFSAILLVPAGLSAAYLRAGGTPWLVGAAVGFAAFAILVAPSLRRTGASGVIDFLRMRLPQTGTARLARIVIAVCVTAVGAGLLWIEAALVNQLAGLLGAAAGTSAMAVMVSTACAVVLLGGMQATTLVNAYLGFLVALAFTVPAVLAQAGLGVTIAALGPLSEVGSLLLAPLPGWSELAFVVLGTMSIPIWALRQSAVGRGRASQPYAWALLIGFVLVAALFVLPERPRSLSETSRVLSLLPSLGWLTAVWGAMTMTLFVTARAVMLLAGQPRTGPAGWLVRTAAIRFLALAGAGCLVWAGASRNWVLEPWMMQALLTGAAVTLAPAVLAAVAWPRAEARGMALAPLLGASGLALGWMGILSPALGAWVGLLSGAAAIVACGYLFDDRAWRMRWLNPTTAFPTAPN